MARINMRDYYPFYEHEGFVEVSDELAAEWRNGIVPKVRKGAKCIAIMRIILWIGVMKSAGMCFYMLLRRMNIMKSVLPLNSFMLR